MFTFCCFFSVQLLVRSFGSQLAKDEDVIFFLVLSFPPFLPLSLSIAVCVFSFPLALLVRFLICLRWSRVCQFFFVFFSFASLSNRLSPSLASRVALKRTIPSLWVKCWSVCIAAYMLFLLPRVEMWLFCKIVPRAFSSRTRPIVPFLPTGVWQTFPMPQTLPPPLGFPHKERVKLARTAVARCVVPSLLHLHWREWKIGALFCAKDRQMDGPSLMILRAWFPLQLLPFPCSQAWLPKGESICIFGVARPPLRERRWNWCAEGITNKHPTKGRFHGANLTARRSYQPSRLQSIGREGKTLEGQEARWRRLQPHGTKRLYQQDRPTFFRNHHVNMFVWRRV